MRFWPRWKTKDDLRKLLETEILRNLGIICAYCDTRASYLCEKHKHLPWKVEDTNILGDYL